MSRREGIQFAVGELGGLRGSVYSVWFGQRDIYIAKNDLFEVWKATIHFAKPGKTERVAHSGMTAQFARKHGLSTSRHERAKEQWPGMELLPGSDVILEFRLRVPQSELRRLGTSDLAPLNPEDPLDIRWLPTPPVGGASEVTIISAPPTHAGGCPRREDFADNVFFGRQLASGRFVWLTYHFIPAPSSADLQAYRDYADRNMGKSRQKYRRFVASINCGDRTSSFAEFLTNYGARLSSWVAR
jgi:hypothetical protein